MVFKKNSRSYFKNNDEASILAPESAEERGHQSNVDAVCVLWTAHDDNFMQHMPEDDESDVLHAAQGACARTWRLTVRRHAVAPRTARTIHSVQGLGFDAVIYVLLKPCFRLSANGHYPCITRARKRLCLLGDPGAFGNPPARAKDVRRTLLPALLRAILGQPVQIGRRTPQLPEAELEKIARQARDRAALRVTLRKAVRLLIWDNHMGKESECGPCSACGKRITIEFMHAAHDISIASGGSNLVDNLRPCCSSCKLSIGVRNLDEFRRALLAERAAGGCLKTHGL